MDLLINLYPKLSPGGYLIVDAYRDLDTSRQAVTDYRRQHNITEEIHFVDGRGVYWRKDSDT